MAEDLVNVRDLSKRYDKQDALMGISATLPKGSFGLLGPNGAGKSTLIKLLMGLLRPTAGEIRVLGRDPQMDALGLRQRLGYMPEGECFVPGLDAVQLCSLAAELNGLPPGEAKQRANTVLSYVGLEDKRYLKVENYSTGQKQRVKLAQALVHDPELLFLDEPTNGLDPRGRKEMLALIKQLPERRGCSIILSSHLLPDVESVCDQAIVLASGRLRYSGSIDALRNADEVRYAVQIKGDDNAYVAALTQKKCDVHPVDNMFHVSIPDALTTDVIFEAAHETGAQIRHLAPQRQSLESALLDVLEDAP